jgi:hypothetical protein
LFARPAPKEVPAPTYFSAGFKFAIAESLYRDGHDGSLRRDIMLVKPDKWTYALLDGMLAASGKGEFREDVMKFRHLLDDNPQGIEIWIGDWNDHGDTEPEDDEEPDLESTTAPPDLRRPAGEPTRHTGNERTFPASPSSFGEGTSTGGTA